MGVKYADTARNQKNITKRSHLLFIYFFLAAVKQVLKQTAIFQCLDLLNLKKSIIKQNTNLFSVLLKMFCSLFLRSYMGHINGRSKPVWWRQI